MPEHEFDAVVLAGGRGSRLGGPVKPEVVVGGLALLDHALAAVADARHVVIVGPPSVARDGVPTVLEDPPDGGPVAGLAAGLTALEPKGVVVVLACDIPRAGRALPALVAAVSSSPDIDGARLVSTDGHPQHLVSAYRASALDRAFARLGDPRGASMRALVAGLVLVDIADTDDSAADADTWADIARLDAALDGRIEP